MGFSRLVLAEFSFQIKFPEVKISFPLHVLLFFESPTFIIISSEAVEVIFKQEVNFFGAREIFLSFLHDMPLDIFTPYLSISEPRLR